MAVKIVAEHSRHGFTITVNVDGTGDDSSYGCAVDTVIAEMTMALHGVPGGFVAGTDAARRWLRDPDTLLSYRLRRPWRFGGWLVTITRAA